MDKLFRYELLAILLLCLSAFGMAKDVILTIEGVDADSKADAVVLSGTGTFNLTLTITNNLSKQEYDRPVDIMFVLDASNSMQAEINSVKNSINSIVSEINSRCTWPGPGPCVRVGMYVYEGVDVAPNNFIKCTPTTCPGGRYETVCTRINKKCSETTDIPCNDNEFLDDRAYIDFTENSEEIAENLDKISAGGGKPARCEPWGDIIKFVLGSDTFSWRPEATWVIINIMDEDDDSAKYMEAAQLAADNNVWLFGIIGYAGGLYGSTKAEQQFDEMLTIAKGKRYSYTDTSEIPNRIMDALSTVLASDSFVLSLEEGPDWDNIAGNLEISNVAREGGTTTITLTLDIPSTSANPVEYVKYRVYVKDNPAIFDDGWIEVTLNTPPQADFVAIPKTGVTPLWVDFDATLSTDAENNIVKYHWDFGDGNTSETSSPKTFHVYRDEGPFFVTLTVEDAAGETDTITKQIYPYSTVALLTVYASDVKIGGMTRVGAKCSKDVNVELRLYKLSSSGMTKIFPPLQTFTITCNVQEVEFGPLYEQGIYMVEAVLLIPPQLCELSCDKASTFLVFSPSPKMLVSEVSLITFLILFAVVLTFINAFRLRR